MTAARALLAACLGIGGLSACDGMPVSPSNERLRLSAQASSSLVLPGATETITFRLENLSSEEITLTFPNCQISPYVRRAGGDVVYPRSGSWICAQVITHLTLPPGGATAREVRLTSGPELAGVVTLPAGDYEAYAVLNDPAFPLVSPTVHVSIR